ncbi:hypothetical protein ABS767_07165 [Sphingomonas sp. ST-64]|uniref:Uncharacterized protein n=1 Tax=Sphingomonas plantiphila TaxID=3163295 RepID=A0ABW8YKF0_9SPHN
MIAAMLLAMAVQTPAPATAATPEDSEIVVIGRQLRSWRGTWRLRDGKVACKTTKSTGDEAVDRIGCQAMIACIAPKIATIDAIATETKDKATFQTRLNTVIQAQTPCFEAERNQGIASLAATRGSK